MPDQDSSDSLSIEEKIAALSSHAADIQSPPAEQVMIPPPEPGMATPPDRKEPKQTGRPPKTQVSPTLKKALPAKELIIIKKRFEGGQIGKIGQASLEDIADCGNFTSYVERNLKPKWKGGEYFFYLLKPDSSEEYQGKAFLPDPPNDAASDPTGSAMTILDRADRMRKDAADQAAIESEKRRKEMLDMITILKGQGQDKLDPMTLLLVRDSLSSSKPVQASDGSGELIKLLLPRLLEPKSEPMPLMPMPAPDSPLKDIAAVITAVRPDPQPQRETFGWKDLVALAPTIKDLLSGSKDNSMQLQMQELKHSIELSKKDKSLVDSMKEMAAIFGFVEKLRGGAAGGAANSENFWMFMNNLVTETPSIIEQITNLVVNKGQKFVAGKNTKKLPAPKVDLEKYKKVLAESADDSEIINALIQCLAELSQKYREWAEKSKIIFKAALDKNEEKLRYVMQVFVKWLFKDAGEEKAKEMAEKVWTVVERNQDGLANFLKEGTGKGEAETAAETGEEGEQNG